VTCHGHSQSLSIYFTRVWGAASKRAQCRRAQKRPRTWSQSPTTSASKPTRHVVVGTNNIV
jgi:hypothetical protein